MYGGEPFFANYVTFIRIGHVAFVNWENIAAFATFLGIFPLYFPF